MEEKAARLAKKVHAITLIKTTLKIVTHTFPTSYRCLTCSPVHAFPLTANKSRLHLLLEYIAFSPHKLLKLKKRPPLRSNMLTPPGNALLNKFS